MNRFSSQKIIDELEKQVEQKAAEITESGEKYFSLINAVDGIVWEADAKTTAMDWRLHEFGRNFG